ncbi:MAG: hypothetical protein A2Z38_01830 [Planctomycetes bacterium RBG_19FT_COMBO_48_8]|nr:MAG: hypothetical protein A2Z38_01830 [Planctomycetes bacterium RBG_19FT_COMBO_48_8]
MAKWSRYNVFVRENDIHVLLFNIRTGALIRLNPERQRDVKNPSNISFDFLEFLLQQGFLVGDDIDELELIANTHKAAKENTDSLSVTIELTQACNFRCLYCYQQRNPKRLKDQAYEKVCRYLTKKINKLKRLHVNWFGGEPLIELQTLKQLSQRLRTEASDHGCVFSHFLTTNGYMITPTVAEELADIGIQNVQITLDGDKQAHNRLRIHASGTGTYEKVLAACKHVVDAGMELLVRINLNRWNVQHINGLLSDLAANGISPENSIVHVTRTVDHGNIGDAVSSAILNTEQFARQWIKILQTITGYGFATPSLAPIAYNCTFDLRQTLMINSDGTICRCSSSSERIAELNEAGDESNHTNSYQTVKVRYPLDDLKCKECLYLPMCMGGCSYLEEIGQEKCIPERYILPKLVLLAAGQVKKCKKGGDTNGTSKNGTSTGTHSELL